MVRTRSSQPLSDSSDTDSSSGDDSADNQGRGKKLTRPVPGSSTGQTRTMWQPLMADGTNCKYPAVVPGHAEEIDLATGSERPPRPAHEARRASKRCAAENPFTWGLDETDLNWSSRNVAPPEKALGDCGWAPGPSPGCALPPFTGGPPGAVKDALRRDTAAPLDYVRELLPRQVLQKVAQYTADNLINHLEAKEERGDPLSRVRDTCMQPEEITWETIELWLAVRCRTGMLNEHVPVSKMWDQDSWAYQADIDELLPLHKYHFLNRFVSFADPNDDSQVRFPLRAPVTELFHACVLPQGAGQGRARV